jgi:hypothetical protein
VADSAADIRAHGFTAAMMPGRQVKTGEPTVAVTSPGPGELDVRGWVHTPGPGVAWVRVLDTDLVAWEGAAVATGTREILGASDNPKQLFYFQGRFPVPSGAAFSGTVEVWHQADGGGPPTRLAAAPATIPAR